MARNILNVRLLDAVKNGEINKARTLIQTGANENCRDEEGTPLLIAIKNVDYGMAKMLLEEGADINDKSFDTTPLIRTIQLGHKRKFGTPYIENSFADDYYEMFCILLENNADIHEEDGDGRNAVYHMLERGLYYELFTAMQHYAGLTEEEVSETLEKVHGDILASRPRDFGMMGGESGGHDRSFS